MNGINSFYSSPGATASLMRAFMDQSRAAILQQTTFFSGKDAFDSVDFTQTALDSSFLTSIFQAGNSAIFGGIYKNADAFNQSLMTSVSASAGLKLDFNDSLIGQLVNQVA